MFPFPPGTNEWEQAEKQGFQGPGCRFRHAFPTADILTWQYTNVNDCQTLKTPARAWKNIMDKDKTIALRVPSDMADRIKVVADLEMLSTSAWVRRAVLLALQAAEAAAKSKN
ncbi:MAG: hypothetical protein QM661_14735 [Solimonas sp.]